MENEKVFAMSFSKVYGLLIAKAERKGRTREEVEKVTFWLTGYTAQQIDELMDSEISYGDFFRIRTGRRLQVLYVVFESKILKIR